MIKVISFKICPFVQRVTAALQAKNIPYEIEYISLKDKPQWFLDISPNGQVPVMVTQSGVPLFESDAIVEYIEDQFGSIEDDVSNEQRALDRAWGYLATKHYLAQCSAMRSADKQTFEQRAEKVVALFTKVEGQLDASNSLFKSDRLSNVDIAWLPLLHRAHIIKQHTGYDFLCGLPKAQAWQRAVLATLTPQKTVSADFEAQFVDFYLTNTYLGTGEDVSQAASCGTNDCCD